MIGLVEGWRRISGWIGSAGRRPPVAAPADGAVQEAVLPQAAGQAAGDLRESLRV